MSDKSILIELTNGHVTPNLLNQKFKRAVSTALFFYLKIINGKRMMKVLGFFLLNLQSVLLIVYNDFKLNYERIYRSSNRKKNYFNSK
jgi:hypothetical protein